MSRVQLTCSCGWIFFVSQASGATATCPSCGNEVQVPGGGLPSRLGRRRRGILTYLVLAAAAILGAFLVIAIWPSARPGRTPTGGETPPTQGPRTGFTPPPIAPTEELPRRKQYAAEALNLMGITAELLRARGHDDEANRIEQDMAKYVADLDAVVARLRDQGGDASRPDHLRPGDVIMFFDSFNLSEKPPKEKEAFLAGWLRRLKPDTTALLSVRRDAADVPLYLYFVDLSPDLRAIASAASVDVPTPAPEPEVEEPSAPKKLSIPTDLRRRARQSLLTLPSYYLLPLGKDGREKLNRMLETGRATEAEIQWLRTTVADVPAVAAEEVDFFAARVADLEGRVRGSGGVDTIVLNTGERREGKLVRETEAGYELQIKIGGAVGIRKIRREDVKEVIRGAGANTEFDSAYRAAKDDAAGLSRLLAWCQQRNLRVETQLVAYALLARDPGNEAARKALGHARDANGLWSFNRSDTPRAQIEAAAEAVFNESDAFQDVIAQVRLATRNFRYGGLVRPPAEFAPATRHMSDALAFRPSALAPDALAQLESWWGKLSVAKKKEFVRFFALYSAMQRYQLSEK